MVTTPLSLQMAFNSDVRTGTYPCIGGFYRWHYPSPPFGGASGNGQQKIRNNEL